MIAARTDEKLNATMRHELGQYAAKIHDAARALPGAESFARRNVPGAGGVADQRVRRSRRGRGVLPQPDIAERRISVLTALLTAALPNGGADSKRYSEPTLDCGLSAKPQSNRLAA